MASFDNIRTTRFNIELTTKLAGFSAATKELKTAQRNLSSLLQHREKLEKMDTRSRPADYAQQMAKVNKSIATAGEQVGRLTSYTAGLVKQMKIEEQSLASLLRLRRDLNTQIRNLPSSSKEFKETAVQLSRVNAQIGKVNGRIGEVGKRVSVLGGLRGNLTKLFGVFGVGLAAVQAVSHAVSALGSKLRDVSELYSDIRKTTDLSLTDTVRLTSQLGSMDSRTDITERMGYAVVGGRMGIRSVTDLKEFAEAADKMVVSLGDSIEGNAEDIVTKMAKIVSAFNVDSSGIISIGEAMERVGSTLNTIGASGPATESWQVDFLYRTGAISRALDISVQDMIGYGAVLEETGNQVEVSGTAMSQLIGVMARDVEVYASRAGMSIQDFTYYLEHDANAALLAVLKNIKEGAVSNTELVQAFSELGIDGERATKTIISLANNYDAIIEKQEISRRAFEENTSLAAEFAKRQESIAGSWSRIWNAIANSVIGTGITRTLQEISSYLADIFAIPVSSQLADQYGELARNEVKLQDVNVAWEDKLDVLSSLRREYPGIFDDIQSEIDLQNSLGDAILRANQYLTQKIALQKANEDSDLAAEALASAQVDYAEQVVAIRTVSNTIRESLGDRAAGVADGGSSDLAAMEAEYRALRGILDAPQDYRGAAAVLNAAQQRAGISNRQMTNLFDDARDMASEVSRLEAEFSEAQKKASSVASVLSDTFGTSSSASTSLSSMSKSDFMATLRAFADGGSQYMISGSPADQLSEIDKAMLSEILSLEKRVLPRISDISSVSSLRLRYQGSEDYNDYAAWLRTIGTPAPPTTDAGGGSRDIKSYAEFLAEMQASAQSDTSQLTERERIAKKYNDIIAETISSIPAEWSEQEQSAMKREVESTFGAIRDAALSIFDEKYQSELTSRAFGLGDDQELAIAQVKTKWAERQALAREIISESADPQAVARATSFLDRSPQLMQADIDAVLARYMSDDASRAARREADVSLVQRYTSGDTSLTEAEFLSAQQMNDMIIQMEADGYATRQELYQNMIDSRLASGQEYLTQALADNQRLIADEKKIQETKRDLWSQAVSISQKFADTLFEYQRTQNNASMEAEIAAAGGNQEKILEIKKKYAEKNADLKVKELMVDYIAGMAQIMIQNMVAHALLPGLGLGLMAAQLALYTAQMGAQLAAVRAQASSFAGGSYGAILADDGRTYHAHLQDSMSTQFVRTPTYFRRQNAIVGERMPEVIISGPDVRTLQRIRPDVIDVISSLPGARGFAAGSYSALGSSAPSTSSHNADLARVLTRLERVLSSPIDAIVVPTENNVAPLRDTIEKINARRTNSKNFKK